MLVIRGIPICVVGIVGLLDLNEFIFFISALNIFNLHQFVSASTYIFWIKKKSAQNPLFHLYSAIELWLLPSLLNISNFLLFRLIQ